jgi:hypothetical protein
VYSFGGGAEICSSEACADGSTTDGAMVSMSVDQFDNWWLSVKSLSRHQIFIIAEQSRRVIDEKFKIDVSFATKNGFRGGVAG